MVGRGAITRGRGFSLVEPVTIQMDRIKTEKNCKKTENPPHLNELTMPSANRICCWGVFLGVSVHLLFHSRTVAYSPPVHHSLVASFPTMSSPIKPRILQQKGATHPVLCSGFQSRRIPYFSSSLMRLGAASTTDGQGDDGDADQETGKPSKNDPSSSTNTPQKSFWSRIRNFFRSPDDGLTFKERLAKYGIAAVLSYLFISNVGGCLAVSAAWYIFSATYHLSPLAPGQWKGFLAIYSGFFVFLNVIRPLRFALALTVSPQFERMIRYLQRRYGFSRPVAIAVMVFVFNVTCSFAVLFGGVALASLVSGVPVWAT